MEYSAKYDCSRGIGILYALVLRWVEGIHAAARAYELQDVFFGRERALAKKVKWEKREESENYIYFESLELEGARAKVEMILYERIMFLRFMRLSDV